MGRRKAWPKGPPPGETDSVCKSLPLFGGAGCGAGSLAIYYQAVRGSSSGKGGWQAPTVKHKDEVLLRDGIHQVSTKGVPQGRVISPLLYTLYLHSFGEASNSRVSLCESGGSGTVLRGYGGEIRPAYLISGIRYLSFFFLLLTIYQPAKTMRAKIPAKIAMFIIVFSFRFLLLFEFLSNE